MELAVLEYWSHEKSFPDTPPADLAVVIAGVLEILKHEGFIADYSVDDSGPQGALNVFLKYDKDVKPIILGLKRISRQMQGSASEEPGAKRSRAS